MSLGRSRCHLYPYVSRMHERQSVLSQGTLKEENPRLSDWFAAWKATNPEAHRVLPHPCTKRPTLLNRVCWEKSMSF